MKAKRILLLMDNRDDSNWGSQATTTSLIRLLSQHHPEAKIRGVPRSATRPKNALKRRISDWTAPPLAEWGMFAQGLGAEVFSWLTADWRTHLDWCDLVVVNGEGTLHPQKQTLRWMPVLKWIESTMRKPVWIVNSSVQFVGHSGEGLYKSVLGSADRVVVREPRSHDECHSAGIRSILAADCAFFCEPERTENLDRWMGEAIPEGPFAVMTGSATVSRWPVWAQLELIGELKRTGFAVIYSTSTEEDDQNYRLLAQAGQRLPVVTHRDVSFAEYCHLISRAEVLIGGRFHPIIFASKVGTPFVAVESSTFKMEGLTRQLNCPEQLCQSADLPTQVGALRRALRERKDRGASLLAVASVLCERTHLNATDEIPDSGPH